MKTKAPTGIKKLSGIFIRISMTFGNPGVIYFLQKSHIENIYIFSTKIGATKSFLFVFRQI